MSKLTDLINELSSALGKSNMSNEEFKIAQHILLEMRIEVRNLELRLSQISNITISAAPTYSATPYSNGTDVVV